MALNDFAYYNVTTGLIENVIWVENDVAPTLVWPDGYAIVDIPDGGVAGEWSMCGIGWSYVNSQFVEPAYNPAAYAQLTQALSEADTEIAANSTAYFAPTGYLLIGNELVNYTGISGNTFTGVTRGVNGTTAAAHSVNSLIRFIGQ